MSTSTPLPDFKDRLRDFATGTKHGIRNPFVIVPVKPSLEQLAAQHLSMWSQNEAPVPTTVVYLDRVMPKTQVFQTVVGLPDSFHRNGNDGDRTEREEKTLRDNLAVEMVQHIVTEHRDACEETRRIVLLLHLGALYPFARASELLDEMDRRRVRATIGIPFPGEIIGGRLSFFGERARHYYPAHRIQGQITEADLQE